MICVTRGPWSCPSAPSLQHPMSSLSLGAGMEPLPPSVPACSHSASEPGCSALLPLLLTVLFLALTLSFSSSSLLFLAPGRSSATSPSSLCLSWRSHGSRAHSHDHLECLRSPGLRLPPSPGAGGSGRGTEKLFQPPPGAGTGVPRARSSKPYSPPTTSAITGAPAVSRRRTDPEAAGGSPWPPAGPSVTASPRRRCRNVVVGVPTGFWKQQDRARAFTAKPGAPHPQPPQPLRAVSVCRRTLPTGICSWSVYPCSPPCQPHLSTALVLGEGVPAPQHLEQPGLPQPCRIHHLFMPFTFVTK